MTLRTRKRSLSHIIHGLGRRHTPPYFCEHIPQGHFIPTDGHGNSVLSITSFATVVTGIDDVSGIFLVSILRDYNNFPLNRKAISIVHVEINLKNNE